jgi:hypothetical protein
MHAKILKKEHITKLKAPPIEYQAHEYSEPDECRSFVNTSYARRFVIMKVLPVH